MTLDDMLTTWQAQDRAPLYGVNRDLLQLVIRHEHADMRRDLRMEALSTFVTTGVLLGFLGLLVAALAYNRLPRTAADYIVAGLSCLAVMGWAGALLVSRKRQALRERGFGNSLRAEILRNLSLIEYQLSRSGRWQAALLSTAPVLVATSLMYWLIVQINNNPFGWFDAWMVIFIVGSGAWVVIRASRKTRNDLLPRWQRLHELLALLNTSE